QEAFAWGFTSPRSTNPEEELVDGKMTRKPLAGISNQQEVSLPFTPIAGKKRNIGSIMDIVM
ncbi:1680_t:CDS:2, partial [Dentiscutata erythropus]